MPKGPGLFAKCSFTTINSFRFRELKTTVNCFFRSFAFVFRTFHDVRRHGCRRSWSKFPREKLLKIVDGLSGNFIVVSDGSLIRFFDLFDFILSVPTADMRDLRTGEMMGLPFPAAEFHENGIPTAAGTWPSLDGR